MITDWIFSVIPYLINLNCTSDELFMYGNLSAAASVENFLLKKWMDDGTIALIHYSVSLIK